MRVMSVYNAAMVAAWPLVAGYFAYNGLPGRKYHGTLATRFGRIDAVPCGSRPVVWVHAVSVGEAVGAAVFVRRLLAGGRVDVVMSCTTMTGMEILKNTFGESLYLFYFPIDAPWIMRRVMGVLRPAALVLMETELWPNAIREAKRAGAKVVMVNGRVSDRMAAAEGIVRRLYGELLPMVDAFGMQSERDAGRIVALGAPAGCVSVTGNLKFDCPSGSADAAKIDELKMITGAGKCELFLAGSTHPGEEEKIIEVYRTVSEKRHGLRLVIAPRHVERADDVAELCRGAGYVAVKRSECGAAGGDGGVIVWDTIGELRALYAIAGLCFVGGSLVERGGHNILEPATCGKAPFFGPYMANFAAAVDAMTAGGGAVKVDGTLDFIQKATDYLNNENGMRDRLDRAALETVRANAGAVDRCAAMVSGCIGE